jgi:hypothetical protein
MILDHDMLLVRGVDAGHCLSKPNKLLSALGKVDQFIAEGEPGQSPGATLGFGRGFVLGLHGHHARAMI